MDSAGGAGGAKRHLFDFIYHDKEKYYSRARASSTPRRSIDSDRLTPLIRRFDQLEILLASRSIRVGDDRRRRRLRHHQALRIRHDRREQIDLAVERFAEAAQQAHHAPDQQHVGGNFDDGIRFDRARQLFVELLDEVLVGVSLLRLHRAAEKQVGKRQQRVGIAVARAEAELVERRDNAFAVRTENRKRQSHDAVAEGRRKILGQPEVEQHDSRTGLNENVAGMRVGVEEAVAQDLVAENFDELLRNEMLVDAGALERVDVGDLDALDQFHREHAPRGELAINLGHQHQRIGGEVAAHDGGVVGLVNEVELHRDVLERLAHEYAIVEVALEEREPSQHQRQVA